MTALPASQRFVCIHGHFYQPPREDPWLESVQTEDSAYPYHDWNQRVTAECYAPNAFAHILDREGRVERIVNNYSRISFNFGPTLLAWLEREAPEVYQAVLEGDRESRRRYGGHGSALAQAYSHLIMPLANVRDKRTQVAWGVGDFERRFRRRPEGMWLPETAADLETLEALAREGIAFTILEPSQALRVRPISGGPWTDVAAGRIDTTQPYLVRLPSGGNIAVFFYHGLVSRGVAFEGLLNNGDAFARRLASTFRSGGPQLAHIATDGESYGHHHRFGDMALAYALEVLEGEGLARLTNYGQYLELYPPVWEVQIAEGSSWSCRHGVERWRAGCGCNTGANPSWSQAWRAPLREALDWLRNALLPAYEKTVARLLKDPWAARDDYVSVVLDRSPTSVEAFLATHSLRPLDDRERVRVLKLLEMQRHAMLMFASCGWFFDEPSRIETMQVLKYAARAMQLALELTGEDLEPAFLRRLEHMQSNLPEQGDGRRIYQRHVKPFVVDWDRVAGGYAVSSIYEESSKSFYVFGVQEEDLAQRGSGSRKALAGRATFASTITGETTERAFLVWDEGGLKPEGRVMQPQAVERSALLEWLEAIVSKGQPPGAGLLPGAGCSMDSLFEDDRRRIMAASTQRLVAPVKALFWQTYESRAAALQALAGQGLPVPQELQLAAEFFINVSLKEAVGDPGLPVEEVRRLVAVAQELHVRLDSQALGHRFGRTLAQAIAQLVEAPGDVNLLERLAEAAVLAQELPFAVHIAEAQNALYRLLREQKEVTMAMTDSQRGRELLGRLAEELKVACGVG